MKRAVLDIRMVCTHDYVDLCGQKPKPGAVIYFFCPKCLHIAAVEI